MRACLRLYAATRHSVCSCNSSMLHYTPRKRRQGSHPHTHAWLRSRPKFIMKSQNLNACAPSAESALSATHTRTHTHTRTPTEAITHSELLTRFATFAAELMWLWFSGCRAATSTWVGNCDDNGEGNGHGNGNCYWNWNLDWRRSFASAMPVIMLN